MTKTELELEIQWQATPCSPRLAVLYFGSPSEEMQKGFLGGRPCSFPPRARSRYPSVFGCHPDAMETPTPSILEIVLVGLTSAADPARSNRVQLVTARYPWSPSCPSI